MNDDNQFVSYVVFSSMNFLVTFRKITNKILMVLDVTVCAGWYNSSVQ